MTDSVRETIHERAQREEIERLRHINSHLIRAAKRAAEMLNAVAGDIEDGGSLDTLRGKYTMALINARDFAREAIAKAEGG